VVVAIDDTLDANAMILELQQVEKSFPLEAQNVEVLRGVNFSVRDGEFLTLMGPSGSGKSTLLNVVCGLEPPTSGTVLLAGQDLYALDETRRTLLRRDTTGFVFQFFNLIPHLTVEENVALPLRIAGQDPRAHHAHIEALLDMVGIGHRATHRPSQLSGGEMQRVTIARALVARPRVVLADEPTGNVSERMGREIMLLLRQCNREFGQTILLVTHSHRDAAFGDRVLFLHDGRISADSALHGHEVDEARVLSRLEELGI
jgi:putative ABC transport system ATP-binding protein